MLLLPVGSTLIAADGNYSAVRRHCVAKAALQVETVKWPAVIRYMRTPNPETLPPHVDGAAAYVHDEVPVLRPPLAPFKQEPHPPSRGCLGQAGFMTLEPSGYWNITQVVRADDVRADPISQSAPSLSQA